MSDFWVALIAALVYIPLLLMWVFVVVDLFGRIDLSGWAKALWLIGIIVLPFFGALLYLITRPVTEEDRARAKALAERRAGAVTSAADELERLAKLHDQGQINDDEYAQLKMRVVGAM